MSLCPSQAPPLSSRLSDQALSERGKGSHVSGPRATAFHGTHDKHKAVAAQEKVTAAPRGRAGAGAG